MDEAVLNLRRLILAGEHYRQVVAEAIGLGTTESQALSFLAVYGSSGQSEMARNLGLTSSALTALVDRLERQGVAERVRHPRDRRRTIVQVTERGEAITTESHRWLAATLDRIDPAELDMVSASLAVIGERSSRPGPRGKTPRCWVGRHPRPAGLRSVPGRGVR